MLETILARHDAVEFALSDTRLSADLREILRKAPDMDRALSRLALDRAGPRDLTAIRAGLAQALSIHSAIQTKDLPELWSKATDALLGHDDLVSLLDDALIAEPPMFARDGGFIASGYHSELDEARQLRDEGRSVVASMQAEYIELCGVQSLKIKHNNVLGYFI